jgi:polyisoprenoid-binding protein YceI
MKRHLLTAAALVALAACSGRVQSSAHVEKKTELVVGDPSAPQAGEPVASTTPDPKQPAGLYSLDPAHTTVLFKLSHLGFSGYTASFSKVAGDLQLDPARPEASSLSVAIDTRSLTLPAPPAGFHDTLTGPQWLDAARCPQITFKSTKVTRTGPATADIAGDLTVHCVTKPVTIQARFNGGYPPNAYDGARVGFSGKTSFRRSDFGLASGIPAPGTNMGVGDRVDVTIETEFGMQKE